MSNGDTSNPLDTTDHDEQGQGQEEGSVHSASIFTEFGFGRRAVHSIDSSALGPSLSSTASTEDTSWSEYLSTSLFTSLSPLSAVLQGRVRFSNILGRMAESSCELLLKPLKVDCKELRHSIFTECATNMIVQCSPYYALSCFLFFMK
jgi:hypothetical protein